MYPSFYSIRGGYYCLVKPVHFSSYHCYPTQFVENRPPCYRARCSSVVPFPRCCCCSCDIVEYYVSCCVCVCAFPCAVNLSCVAHLSLLLFFSNTHVRGDALGKVAVQRGEHDAEFEDRVAHRVRDFSQVWYVRYMKPREREARSGTSLHNLFAANPGLRGAKGFTRRQKLKGKG